MIWIAPPDSRHPDNGGPVDQRHVPFGDPAHAEPIIRILQSVCERNASRVALEEHGREVTYRELLTAVCSLTERIHAAGPASGPVGILLPTTAAYVIAVFAALAAGRLCVLLDSGYPGARNAEIAAATGIGLLLTTPDDIRSLNWPGVTTIDATASCGPGGPSVLPSTGLLGLDEPAFILCTSGSSGAPKAIVHSQRTMLHWTRTTHNGLRLCPDDRVLSLSSMSTLGGFVALLASPLAGASIQMLEVKTSGLREVMETLASRPVTILRATPSLMRGLAPLPDIAQTLAGLRIVQTYGEPLMKADLAEIMPVLPSHCRLRSTYGSTEASGMSWLVGESDDHDPFRVASGRLLPDTMAAILDDEGQPCAPGEVGELVIRSRYNALGEWVDGTLLPGRLERVADDDTRIFRTGDLARCNADGIFVVLGRKDRMVKINGQRLEPAEIEAAIRRNAMVERAEVVLDRRPGRPMLLAFVVARENGGAGLVAQIRRDLRRLLPTVMVPARIVLVASIPLLPGGKADSAALLDLLEDVALADQRA